MRKRQGLTLVELMVVVAMSSVIVGALGSAYSLALDYAQRTPARLDDFQSEISRKNTLESLFRGAYLSTVADDPLTYFAAFSNSGQGSVPDTESFTSLGNPSEGGFLRATETDFETLNERYGAQAGMTEVSLSIVPVGDAGERVGLFLRTQRPADGDPTQGGTERLLWDGVTQFDLEFWDGQQWITTWDTRTGARRLPAAVRLNITVDEQEMESIVLRLPNSDVTSTNPLVQSTDGQGGTGP